MIRLQKFLSEAGICSRRKAEEYILAGRVKVNGVVVDTLGTKVSVENDIVYFDDKKVEIKNDFIYIMLNKPEGCVTTVKDQFGRKTVFDYVDIEKRLYPVGRLDYNTSGLILLTNDGDLTYKLTHPKHNIKKTYIAVVLGKVIDQELERFRSGLVIDGYKTAPSEIYVIKKQLNKTFLKIIISEGRNRQVRKMCDEIGLKVIALKRIATGDISLNDLKKGEYRHLTENEVKYLKSL